MHANLIGSVIATSMSDVEESGRHILVTVTKECDSHLSIQLTSVGMCLVGFIKLINFKAVEH